MEVSSSVSDPGGLKVGIVGRGRVARSIVPLLRNSGHHIIWQWTHRDTQPASELDAVDVILLAVPDDAIGNAAAQMAERPHGNDEVWLHFSGCQPGQRARIDAQMPRAAGCLHPLQALSGTPTSGQLLRGATTAIDGDPEAIRVAMRLAQDWGLNARIINPQDKPLYHAAAVSVAGHATALVSQAVVMLTHCGFSDAEARAALIPLCEGALENLKTQDANVAITGPITRGDLGTLQAHLDTLQAFNPHLARTYLDLAFTALSLSERRLSGTQVAEMHTIIETQLSALTKR